MVKTVLNIGKKNYEIEKYHNLKAGIERQREIFKQAKLHSLHRSMADAVDNFKSDIKTIAIKNKMSKRIKKIEKILFWYNNLDNIYATKTENGYQVVFPPDILDKINRNLTIGYEICMEIIYTLDLI